MVYVIITLIYMIYTIAEAALYEEGKGWHSNE